VTPAAKEGRMSRLAIIGTGIAGLGCAHFLHRRFDVEL
jgi:predicted NAD/FAD-binding protein